MELYEETIPFTAGDGKPCNMVRVRARDREPELGPVLLVHGAGVSSDIFRAPVERDLVRTLAEEGYDVWLENWRASIALPFSHWNLDKAAVNDHPFAVRTVAGLSGAKKIKAVIHCQGSTSFIMSAVAGLVPEVGTQANTFELFDLLKEKFPKLPVIVVSGKYKDHPEDFTNKGYKVAAFLPKPVRLNVLKAKIAEVLGIDQVK